MKCTEQVKRKQEKHNQKNQFGKLKKTLVGIKKEIVAYHKISSALLIKFSFYEFAYTRGFPRKIFSFFNNLRKFLFLQSVVCLFHSPTNHKSQVTNNFFINS